MDSYTTESFGPWQGIASGAAVLLAPVAAASYEATGAFFAGMARTDATAPALGAPKAVDTQRDHNSITRPGSPPRGRHR